MPQTIYRTEDRIDFVSPEDAALHEKILKSGVGKDYREFCMKDDVRRVLQRPLQEGETGVLMEQRDWLFTEYASSKNAEERIAGIPRVLHGPLVDVLIYAIRNFRIVSGFEFRALDITEVNQAWEKQIGSY